MSRKKADMAPGSAAGSDFSIVYRLNIRLVWRLAGILLSLDLLLCAAAAAAGIIYAEGMSAAAAEVVETSGLPEEAGGPWLSVAGVGIFAVENDPEGFRVPRPFRFLLPQSTAGGVRSLNVPKIENARLLRRLDGLSYRVGFSHNGSPYQISVMIGPGIRAFKFILFALLIIQLFMLIKSLFIHARMIRETLRPISELAEAAHSLNRAGEAFTPEEMESLAGKLDGINAARLDTRISIEGTQNELKNLAKAINGMLDRINESYRAQIRFVSDASHELRTPISVIQGYANLLDRWGKNDEKTLQESIDAIKDEAANMKCLVEQLLFLARGDSNTMRLQKERVSLPELVSEVVSETKMIDGGHEYGSHIVPAVIDADAALVKQVLRILVDNAIKYTAAGGRIDISVSRGGGMAMLTVQDNGVGIPPESVPLIFDRFYRADESRARATGGAGLGLSIAQWIAERHGGHMEVLSRVDIGTRISVAFPEAEEKPEKTPSEPE